MARVQISPEPLRQNADFLKRFKVIGSSSPSRKNIPLPLSGKSPA